MKRLAWKHFDGSVRKLRKLGQLRAVRRLVAAVDRVSNHRMTKMLHVGPNLVRPPGFEPAGHEGCEMKTLEYFVVGDRMLSVLSVGKYSLNLAVLQRTSNMTGYGSAVFAHVAPNQGLVFALAAVVGKLLGQKSQGVVGTRHYQQAGRVLIDAVN